MPHHQAYIVQLDLLPHRHRLAARRKGLGEVLHTLLHPLVIKSHALALGTLLRRPIDPLEVAFGRLGRRPKQLIVAIDAIHHRPSDVIGLWSIQLLGKHADISCCVRPRMRSDLSRAGALPPTARHVGGFHANHRCQAQSSPSW